MKFHEWSIRRRCLNYIIPSLLRLISIIHRVQVSWTLLAAFIVNQCSNLEWRITCYWMATMWLSKRYTTLNWFLGRWQTIFDISFLLFLWIWYQFEVNSKLFCNSYELSWYFVLCLLFLEKLFSGNRYPKKGNLKKMFLL